MALLEVQIILVLLLSGTSDAAVEGSWCYDDDTCGPQTWTSLGHCNGDRQSPIDIITTGCLYNSSLGPITISGYDDRKKIKELKNTGKTVDVKLRDGVLLTGNGLPGVYMAKAIHFHWGDGIEKAGSEHCIDGKQYSMEMHIVHTRNNMSISEALHDPDGLAVLGFLIQASATAKGKTAKAWESFTKNLNRVAQKGSDVDIQSTVSLRELIGSTNLARYYRYSGSLTTPNCDEAVIWTVFVDPIVVPTKVVEFFPSTLRSTDSSVGPHMESNFRPPQPIRSRMVEASFSMNPRSAASQSSQPLRLILPFLSVSALGFLPD